MAKETQGAEVKQTTFYSTAKMMEEEGNYSANFIDGQLPYKFHMEFKDSQGFRREYSVDPHHGIARTAASIASFANSNEVITKSIMAGCHKLYREVMGKDFPIDPTGDKLVVTKGKDSKFTYEGRKGGTLTLPGAALTKIDALLQRNTESYLWILSELVMKSMGRKANA